LALVFWQRSAEGGRRRWPWLAGLTLSLAGALLVHCYAVLLFVPFAAAELVRCFSRKRIDFPMVLAFLCAAPIILLYIPLFNANSQFVLNNIIFNGGWPLVVSIYEGMLVPALWPLLGSLVLLGLATGDPDAPAMTKPLPVHEHVAAWSFVAIPVLAWLLAVTFTRVFMDRYGVSAVLGISILLGFQLHIHSRSRNWVAAAVFALFAATFLIQFAMFGWAGRAAPTPARMTPEQVEPSLPLVVANGLNFLEVDQQAPPELAARLYYLRSPEAALRYTGSNVFELGYPKLEKWCRLRGRIEDYDGFIAQHPRFLVYGSWSFPLDWLIQKLLDDGVQLRLRDRHGDKILLEARPDGREMRSAPPPGR
jgi:hypothetical protein